VADKLRCPSCGSNKVDTRQMRELRTGVPFKRQMPLVRFVMWVPVISLMEMVSFKAMLVTAGLGGLTAAAASWHNRRGIAASRPLEAHACRQCGYEWKHAPGEPEPAPFGPVG
jgi:rubredoxin